MLAGLNTRFPSTGCVLHSSNPALLNPAAKAATGASSTGAARSTPELGTRTTGSPTGPPPLAVVGIEDGEAPGLVESAPPVSVPSAQAATTNANANTVATGPLMMLRRLIPSQRFPQATPDRVVG